jgi:hypothetical protein
VTALVLFAGAGTPAAPAPAPPITPAPALRVLVNFTGTEDTDITHDVRRLIITRGRSRERETMSPGRCEIDIWNFDGDYDPDNINGAYFPNIRPNKVVRVQAAIDSGTSPFRIGSSSLGGGEAFGGGATYDVDLFTGRLEGGSLTYEEGGLQPQVTWRAIDASKRLNRDRSLTGYGTAAELTGARVNSVLDGATPVWSTTERDIGPGTRTVQVSTGDAGRYDYLLEVAASEFGAFFIGRDGKAVFRDANWEPDAVTPVLGSGIGEYAFSSIEIADDETEIFNAITVTAPGLADQVQQDVASQAELGRSDLPISTILSSTSEMSDVGLTFLNAYSQPRRRISRLHVDRVATDWRFFLSKEIMDRVIVRHRPVYGGVFEQLSVIQGIQITVNGSQDWGVTWNLTPPLSVVSNPNLLTASQSGFEDGSTSGWTVTFTGSPPGNGIYIQGVASGSVPLVGQYAMEVRTFGIAQIQGAVATTPYTTAPVVPGQTYRVSAWVRSYWGTVYWFAQIRWYTSGGSLISQSSQLVFTLGNTEWTNGSIEDIAPVGAAYAAAEISIVENDSGGHPAYIDAVELRHVGA